MKGFFITLEGGEGAGKTTILPLLAHQLKIRGYDVLATREPGGIDIAEKIRQIILNPEHDAMDSRTEALLYAAARRQHLVEKVFPALESGKVVLCDRFIDSSLVYQGDARGLNVDDVLAINQFAIENCLPDLTLLFAITPEKGFKRISENRARERNRLDLEAFAFHEKVHAAYHRLVEQYPNRIQVIDADQSIDKVEQEALAEVMLHLEKIDKR